MSLIDEVTSPRWLFAAVNATSDGDNELVAAVTGRKIRVCGYTFAVDVSGELTFESSTSGPTIATLNAVAGTPTSYSGPVPAFETAAGASLNLVNPAGTDTTGHITYVLTA